jgi:hypothetical protein
MFATLCSYENCFGPYHPQTILLTAQVGIACWLAGDAQHARPLLERAIRDLGRRSSGQTRGANHDMRLRAAIALRDLFVAQEDYSLAAAVQRDLLGADLPS